MAYPVEVSLPVCLYNEHSIQDTTADLNECTEGGSECDQYCQNTVGSYTCSCNSSTTLNPDGLHCDGEYIHSYIYTHAELEIQT